MHHLRFRQVHLDFHTSPQIPGIGEKFNKKEWQETLKRAEVDSITLFATCHHGYAYYDTNVGKRHPNLNFDLLRAQYDACHEIDVATPVYLTAGLNDYASSIHPEWGEMSPVGKVYDPLYPHFHKMCFNSPYLDFLCAEIREVTELFPEANGIFLDIISQGQCCCRHCLAGMLEDGLNPELEPDRREYARRVLLKYYRNTTEAAKRNNPDMPIFHNSGHVTIGNNEILRYFSHLELESLPTGGWGYDHFPMSAAYVRNFSLDFLGMTGKFHTTWGEFGGFKHPNALRYECAAMIANGSKCSIGDQLHPSGKLDAGTYEIIGRAYREVKEKEPWCRGAVSAANTAIVSGITPECHAGAHDLPGDVGAARILLEGQIPFDLIDVSMDFSKYKVLILPDDVRLSSGVCEKIKDFLKHGGKLVLSGESGMAPDRNEFVLDMPFRHEGKSPFQPDYVLAAEGFAPDYLPSPFVMYLASERIRTAEHAVSTGRIFDPYFNRTYVHFCSHQHTPNQTRESGYDAGALTENILYFAHPVFSIYRAYGAVPMKEYILRGIRKLIGGDLQFESDLPSQARMTLMRQTEEKRYLLHLLYANTILRGGVVSLSGGNNAGRNSLEVIEDLNPTGPVEAVLRLPVAIKQIRLVPEGKELAFSQEHGVLTFTVPAYTCHRMIELAY